MMLYLFGYCKGFTKNSLHQVIQERSDRISIATTQRLCAVWLFLSHVLSALPSGERATELATRKLFQGSQRVCGEVAAR